MKHIILSGGRPWYGEDGGKKWVDALLAHCGRDARIAVCLFAQDEADWQETLKINTETITRFAGIVKVELRVMHEDDFVDASNWANIILIPGGDPKPLKLVLEKQDDVLNLWDGKTISGHSAGADVMVRKYIYLQDRTLHEGFGWVPVDFIPHWQADILGWRPEDWAKAESDMANPVGETPFLTIREADFVELSVQ